MLWQAYFEHSLASCWSKSLEWLLVANEECSAEMELFVRALEMLLSFKSATVNRREH
jgi:hypothetical protein